MLGPFLTSRRSPVEIFGLSDAKHNTVTKFLSFCAIPSKLLIPMLL
jgi:hypothetical protein